jgi:hypothetical protein
MRPDGITTVLQAPPSPALLLSHSSRMMSGSLSRLPHKPVNCGPHSSLYIGLPHSDQSLLAVKSLVADCLRKGRTCRTAF